MQGNATLHSIILEDKRYQTQNKWRQLIAPFNNEQEENSRSDILSVQYVKDKEGNQIAEVRLDHPAVVLVPEALFQVQYFFLDVAKDFGDKDKKEKTNEIENENVASTTPERLKEKQPTLTAQINIISPQIIVPHRMSEFNSRALLVRV